jgi:hypothetical protein
MKRAVFLILLVFAGILSGCKTTEPENLSSRPWNAPRGWETGLPSSINEGR